MRSEYMIMDSIRKEQFTLWCEVEAHYMEEYEEYGHEDLSDYEKIEFIRQKLNEEE